MEQLNCGPTRIEVQKLANGLFPAVWRDKGVLFNVANLTVAAAQGDTVFHVRAYAPVERFIGNYCLQLNSDSTWTSMAE